MSLLTRRLYRTLAVVVLTLCTRPPDARAELVSVNSITNNAGTIGVFFGVPVTLPSATNPANYTVYAKTGAVAVVSVDLQTNAQFVALRLAANIGEFFAVNITNVEDVASNTNNASGLGYLSDYGSTDIGIAGNPNPAGQVYTAHGDTFEVTVGGEGVGGTNDFFHFIYQQVIGNFDMMVMVTRLDEANPKSQAGLMARETLARNSRSLQTYFTPVTGSNEVEVAMRSTVAGATTDSGFQIGPRASASSNNWLRLTRTNNAFTAYYGTNGIDWEISGVTTQTFASTLSIGMMAASHTTNGTATTAGFTGFGKQGVRPGDATIPTLSFSLTPTNITLTWPRTPRDYAIEVSTNLTDWALLLLPILEAGTNATQRTMKVPLNLWPDRLFLRAVRVERVIPDPPYWLETGILISPDLYLTSVTSATTLCPSSSNISVVTSKAYSLTGGQVVAPLASLVTFETSDSDKPVDTVLQIRNSSGNYFCDNNALLDAKSRVILTSTAASTTNTYNIIVAPKKTPLSGYTATSVLRVRITY